LRTAERWYKQKCDKQQSFHESHFTLRSTGNCTFPSGAAASFNADGSKMAYMPGIQWQDAWKRYRGGQTYPIWICQMSDSKVKEIPATWGKRPAWVATCDTPFSSAANMAEPGTSTTISRLSKGSSRWMLKFHCWL
jgi:hypothetical protein